MWFHRPKRDIPLLGTKRSVTNCYCCKNYCWVWAKPLQSIIVGRDFTRSHRTVVVHSAWPLTSRMGPTWRLWLPSVPLNFLRTSSNGTYTSEQNPSSYLGKYRWPPSHTGQHCLPLPSSHSMVVWARVEALVTHRPRDITPTPCCEKKGWVLELPHSPPLLPHQNEIMSRPKKQESRLTYKWPVRGQRAKKRNRP